MTALCIGTTCVSAMADGVPPAVATPVQREQAQARFQRGRDLMAKKDYDGALAELRASHEIVSSPNTRLEIARTLRAAGRLVAAYAEFGRTIVEAKELVAQDNRYQRALDSATAERKEIQPQLGFVTLTIQNPGPDTTVTVGGEEIRQAAWAEPAPVLAGQTQVVVMTPGHPAITRALSVGAGETSALTIDAQGGSEQPVAAQPSAPAPAEPGASHGGSSSLRPWAYVAGGIGVAGLATFAIAGLMANSTYNDLQNSCHGGPCPSSKSSEISTGKSEQTVANVGLGVGIAGVAAGATLFAITLVKPSPSGSASLVLGPAKLSLRGTW